MYPIKQKSSESGSFSPNFGIMKQKKTKTGQKESVLDGKIGSFDLKANL